LELKIEILLVSLTNLILTLKYYVPTYNTDWNDNVKWNILHLFIIIFSTYRTQFKKIVRHNIKSVALHILKILFKKK